MTTNGADLLDLVEYAEDHIKTIKLLVDDGMDGATIDCVVARATYAKRRLDQLITHLLEEDERETK